MSAVIYNLQTGQILRQVICYANLVGVQCEDGESYKMVYEPIDDERFYVDVGVAGHAIRERTLQDYTVSTSGLTVTITGLAPGTEVHVAGLMIVADEDPTELEFDVPGVHIVGLSGLAALMDEEIEVQVNG